MLFKTNEIINFCFCKARWFRFSFAKWRQKRKKKVEKSFSLNIIRLSSAICAWKMKVDFITEAIFAQTFSFRHFLRGFDIIRKWQFKNWLQKVWILWIRTYRVVNLDSPSSVRFSMLEVDGSELCLGWGLSSIDFQILIAFYMAFVAHFRNIPSFHCLLQMTSRLSNEFWLIERVCWW